MRTVVLQLDKAALLPLTVVDGVLCPSKGHGLSRQCHPLPKVITPAGSSGAGAAGRSQGLGVGGQAQGNGTKCWSLEMD